MPTPMSFPVFVQTEDYPVVLVTVFVEAFSSQLEAFFTKLFALNYPKKKIHLLIHNFVRRVFRCFAGYTNSRFGNSGGPARPVDPKSTGTAQK